MSKGNPFSIKVEVANIKKGLERKQSNMGKAINATASDFRSRAPGWVSKQVREVYGVDAKSVKDAKGLVEQDGVVQIGKARVKNYKIHYKGRLLTPVHFKMTPKVRKNKPYQIKAEIIKGSKKELHPEAFLGSNGYGQIPFVRKGSERLPIRSIKTISVPQMITSDRTNEDISRIINENLEERLENNIKRYKDR